MASANQTSHITSSSHSRPPQPPPSNQKLSFNEEKETGFYVYHDARTKSESALSTSSSSSPAPISRLMPKPTRRASFPQFEDTRSCLGDLRTLDGDMTTMESPPPPPPTSPDAATFSHRLFNNNNNNLHLHLQLTPHLSANQTVTILINDSHAPRGKEFKVHRELLRFHSSVLRGVLGGAEDEDPEDEDEVDEEEEREIVEEEDEREGTTHRLQLKPRIWEWRWLEVGSVEEVWEREDRVGEVCWVDVRIRLPPSSPPTKPTTSTTRRTKRSAQMKRKMKMKMKMNKKSGVAFLNMRDVDGGLCGVRTWVAFEAWLYLGGEGLLHPSSSSDPQHQHQHQHIRTLIHLWVFAGRIGVPACQNDCIEAIYFFQQKQKHHLNLVVAELPWVYRHTREYDVTDEKKVEGVVVKGCALKKLLLDFWAWGHWGNEDDEDYRQVAWLWGAGDAETDASGDEKANLRIQRAILWDLVRVQQEMLGRKMIVWEEPPFGSRRRRREGYYLPVGQVGEGRQKK